MVGARASPRARRPLKDALNDTSRTTLVTLRIYTVVRNGPAVPDGAGGGQNPRLMRAPRHHHGDHRATRNSKSGAACRLYLACMSADAVDGVPRHLGAGPIQPVPPLDARVDVDLLRPAGQGHVQFFAAAEQLLVAGAAPAHRHARHRGGQPGAGASLGGGAAAWARAGAELHVWHIATSGKQQGSPRGGARRLLRCAIAHAAGGAWSACGSSEAPKQMR